MKRVIEIEMERIIKRKMKRENALEEEVPLLNKQLRMCFYGRVGVTSEKDLNYGLPY